MSRQALGWLPLGFDQSILATFNRLVLDVIAAVADLYLQPDEDAAAVTLDQAVETAAAMLRTTAEALPLQAGDPVSTLKATA